MDKLPIPASLWQAKNEEKLVSVTLFQLLPATIDDASVVMAKMSAAVAVPRQRMGMTGHEESPFSGSLNRPAHAILESG